MAQCYKCNQIEVADEFDRCPSCEATHKELCAKLDARPKVEREKKIREKLYSWKEMKQGVEVTNFISYDEAKIMGIKLPQ